jgi:hypothetical protein
LHRGVGWQSAQAADQLQLIADRRSLDMRNHVAGLQARFGSRRGRHDIEQPRAKAALAALLGREKRWGHAQEAIVGNSARLERFERAAKILIDGNREPATLLISSQRGQRSRNADQLSLEIEQSAAAAAQFQPGVGLNQIAVVMQGGSSFAGNAGRSLG